MKPITLAMKPITEDEIQAAHWFEKAYGVTFIEVRNGYRIYRACWFVGGLLIGYLLG